MTFGARFGLLIRQKREDEGITAGELARRVWDDEARRSRISDLENGKVNRPQAKTIEALTNYFDFSADEIEACRRQPPQKPTTANIDLPQELLENLALRFGHDNPDAPAPELTTFLKEKAKDYRVLQQRLEELTKQDDRLSNLLSAIKAAMDAGKFDEADDRLADAENIQLEHNTLVEVRKQANLRIQRAQTALFKGDADKAAQFFTEAAGYFTPFETNEDAKTLRVAWEALYEHGLRYGGTGLKRAIDLARAGADLHDARGDLFNWAIVQNDLGLSLQNQAGRVEGKAVAKLLAQAITAYEAALTVHTKSDNPINWAMTQNNLGNALQNQAERVEGKAGMELLAKAVAAYEAALTVRTKADHPVGWATIQNNLATALEIQGKRIGGEAGAKLLAKAVAAYEAALTVRTKVDHPVDWAGTQNNLGLAYEAKAYLDPETSRASLEQALVHFDKSLEVYDPVHMPYHHNKSTKFRARVVEKLAALD